MTTWGVVAATAVSIIVAATQAVGLGEVEGELLPCVDIEVPGEVVHRSVGAGTNRGEPPSAPENYAKLIEEFEQRPDDWGGAFVDGETLVVLHTGVRAEALRTIAELDITEGVTLCPSATSYAHLQQAMDTASDSLSHDAGVAGFGPRYSGSSLVVDVLDEKTKDRVAAIEGELGVRLEIRVEPAQPTPGSRYYDTRQYYGGGAIQLRESGSTNCRSYYSPLNNLWFNAGHVDTL